MEFLIVTGMSGAGKSGAANVLEDMGYYCIDNIPPALIAKFSEICMQSKGKISKVAMVVDSRGGDLFGDLLESLDRLKERDNCYKILFLDCDDDVLITRYKETRRKHPLCEGAAVTLQEAIRRERELLQPAHQRANYIIDTTLLTAAQLRDKIYQIFLDGGSRMLINCMSFGFKYGLPSDADLVFDVRCLPNPFYIPELKEKTGRDRPVEDYVLSFEQSTTLLDKLKDLLGYLAPLYVEEGKSQLMVAIGCTGGKHRSVVFTEHLGAFLTEQGYRVVCNHRDILKTKK
ncbi:RNase adapter RapZ [Clostridiaceae bacterium NSJ-31]|uniref:RNase adapter RapZ n=1 Tax=Ligaoa zhengdingensis TaxID=2763658 RepID=A0A926E074_9FIRM|nr:RNase adapter RapZ [Ligaoa zhengdingensis]MBC8546659.1 RNase adapter RapZ [Ligaoa zhengdingensis]